MSLGDYLRYLRALHGGESTLDIAKALGLPSPWPINEIEQRYREVGQEDLLQKLADYYGVALEELVWRRKRSRKAFSEFVTEAQERDHPISLLLRNGDRLQGKVRWCDLGAVALEPADGSRFLVVQRHMVDDWEPA